MSIEAARGSIDPRMDWTRPLCFLCGKHIRRRGQYRGVDCDAGPTMAAHATCLDNKPALEVYARYKKAVDAAILGRSEAAAPLGSVIIEGGFQ